MRRCADRTEEWLFFFSCFLYGEKRDDNNGAQYKRQTQSTYCDFSKVKHLITPRGIEKQICEVGFEREPEYMKLSKLGH